VIATVQRLGYYNTSTGSCESSATISHVRCLWAAAAAAAAEATAVTGCGGMNDVTGIGIYLAAITAM